MKTVSPFSNMYCILFCSSFFFSMQLHAQKQELNYDIITDRHWIDSVNAIIKRGFEMDVARKHNYLKQLKYFNSCIALGQYYETLYNKKILQSKHKAVFYYEKVTDYGRFPEDERYFKALALRNNLCRKLAAIYFDGKGIKKNWSKSLELALKGSSGYSGFFEIYSKKYFGYNSVFLKQKHRPDYTVDTLFEFKINPFAFNIAISPLKISMKNDLEKIANRFKELYAVDSAYRFNITVFAETSANSQAKAYHFSDNAKLFLVNKMGIQPDHILTDIQFDGVERAIRIVLSNSIY